MERLSMGLKVLVRVSERMCARLSLMGRLRAKRGSECVGGLIVFHLGFPMCRLLHWWAFGLSGS